MMDTKPRSAKLKEMRFENARLTALGIEPMTLDHLRRKVPNHKLCQPERVDFFMLMLVTAGSGRHTVDFMQWPLQAGTLVFVRPGQAQQWHPNDDFSATIVLIAPSVLPHLNGQGQSRDLALMALDEWQACLQAATESIPPLAAALQTLQQDFDHFDGSDLEIALIRHALMTLLLRIAKLQQLQRTASGEAPLSQRTYRLFRQILEADFAQQHSLQYYAQRLGYSESTLSRACLAAEGRSAKQVIDRRIALEAQRLLVHSHASIAEVAHQLGFSESTNFVKFFRRQIGQPPSKFRRVMLPATLRETA